MADNSKESLDSFITSALRTRLQDSARAVIELRQQLNAALEKVESSIQIAGEKPIAVPDEVLPAPAAPPAEPGEAAVLAHIHGSQQEMLAATDQVGLLSQLLMSCTVSCPRVAFFIVRKDVLMGWAARGFDQARDADVRSLSIHFDEDTLVGAAYRSGAPVLEGQGGHSGDGAMLEKLGAQPAAEAMAVPIYLRDKIAAVLYGDSGADPEITDPEVPQILALHAGLCLETLATRQKHPRPKTPTLGSRSVVSQPAAAAPPPPAPEPAPAAVSPDPTSLSGVFKKPTDFTPPGGSPAAPQPYPAPQETAAMVEEAVDVAEEEAAPAAPPAPAAAPAAAPADLSPEEQKLHEDAKRFARLLVSEMVLYNEKQVEEGRRNKDIYDRLKDDIDRSRQMYEQRISPEVRGISNYFYEEMVRTLANGDQSALNLPWA